MVKYSTSAYGLLTRLRPQKSYEKDDIDFDDDEEQNVLDYLSEYECEDKVVDPSNKKLAEEEIYLSIS